MQRGFTGFSEGLLDPRWKNYVPILAQGNTIIQYQTARNTFTGEYMLYGDQCTVRFHLIATTTGTANQPIHVSLPFPVESDMTPIEGGPGRWSRTGIGNNFGAWLTESTAGSITGTPGISIMQTVRLFRFSDQLGPLGSTGVTNAVAVGDTLAGIFMYRIGGSSPRLP